MLTGVIFSPSALKLVLAALNLAARALGMPQPAANTPALAARNRRRFM